ncbi:MAG: flagellar filament capping protein FliD [Lachnospiraceae bacterium]|nr:flagellar filament capping protein FliD [Lachnospiraceae bacterium]
MSDTLRMTGLLSGLDTTTLVSALVSVHSAKITKKKNEQTKLSWKQEKWESLNSEIYSFFKGSLDKFTTSTAFNSKTSKVADTSIATVTASTSAVIGTQSLTVKSLAKSAYLTGAKLEDSSGDVLGSSTTLADLGYTSDSSLKITVDSTEYDVSLSSTDTLASVASKIKSATGLTASYDSTNGRFFISASESGEDQNFTIEDGDGTSGLASTLGIEVTDNTATVSGASYVEGSNAVIDLNGAEYESTSNTFSINGLTITATAVSAYDSSTDTYTATSITTDKDIDSIYESIVDFFDEYNSLINKMDALYNADDASDYDILSSDEKSSMSDDEIESWETKIKDALLRRDDTLDSVRSIFTNAMANYTYTDDDDNTYTLSSFGIETLSYFLAGDNEKHAYHIDGNADDSDTSGNEDKLRAALVNDPDTFTSFFTGLAQAFYKNLDANMTSIAGTRSKYKVYNDKELQTEYDDMTDEIEEMEDALSALEDRYYDQFAAMETALSRLQSNQSAVSQLLYM